jgi:hypothetical protein
MFIFLYFKPGIQSCIKWPMRKKLLLYFLTSLFFTSLLSAQKKQDWAFSLTPSIVLIPDPEFGCQVGAMYSFNPKISLLTEFTMPWGGSRQEGVSNAKYFRIKPELRYQISNHRDIENYIALQLSYAARKWNDNNGGAFYNKTVFDDSATSFSNAIVKSPIFTCSAQVGSMIFTSKHLILNFFMGLGVRYIFTKYLNVQDEHKVWQQQPKCAPFFRITYASQIENTVIRFNTNFGLRFLYRL